MKTFKDYLSEEVNIDSNGVSYRDPASKDSVTFLRDGQLVKVNVVNGRDGRRSSMTFPDSFSRVLKNWLK